MRHRARLSGAAGMLACLAAVGLGVPSAGASVRATLRPGTGGIHTGFILRFRNPAVTGTVAGFRRVDRVIVSGPRHRGCVSFDDYAMRPAPAGAALSTTISAGRGRHWCDGHFSGRLVAFQSTACTPGPARACPLLVLAPQTLARFSFRVRSAAPSVGGSGGGGGSGTGGGTGGGATGGSGGQNATDSPGFAGLQAASSCTGAAPAHGSPPGRTYTLSWRAATDPVTPSSGIVYDIFFAASPGGENFASPTWTTVPGATAYSGNLATSGSAYFVVRARDARSHEDTNTVEKLAVNSC